MSTYLKTGRPLEYDNAPDWLVAYMHYLRTILNRTPATVMTYFKDLRSFFQWYKFHSETSQNPKSEAAMRNIDILTLPFSAAENVTQEDIISFLFFCANVLQNSETTRNKKLAALDSFYRYAHKNAGIDNNPAAQIDRPKLPKTKPVYLTESEQLSLLDNIRGENQVRDYAIILLSLVSGLRVSEICSLDKEDINLETKTLRVREGKGSQERIEYLTNSCIAALMDYELHYRNPIHNLSDPKAYFVTKRLGSRITTKAVYNLVKKHRQNAQLCKNITPHKLRHTTATTMAKAGVPLLIIQEHMGHRSPTTTQLYTHLDSDDMRGVLNNTFLSVLGKSSGDETDT